MKRLFGSFMVAVILGLGVGSPITAAASPAEMVVRDFHDALLNVWKRADELGADGRFEELSPKVQEAFDLERMILIAAGSTWRKASEQERVALVDAFTRYSVSTYAARFNEYGGQSFEIVGTRPGPQDTVIVETRLSRPSGNAVTIAYVVAEGNGRWRILDVLLEEKVSELAVRRSEYHELLKRRGPSALTRALHEKANALLTK